MLSPSCSLIPWYRVTENSSGSCTFQTNQTQLEISPHSAWSDEGTLRHMRSQKLHVFNQVHRELWQERLVAVRFSSLYPFLIPTLRTAAALWRSCSNPVSGWTVMFLNYSDTLSWLLQLSNGNKCKCFTLCQSNSCNLLPCGKCKSPPDRDETAEVPAVLLSRISHKVSTHCLVKSHIWATDCQTFIIPGFLLRFQYLQRLSGTVKGGLP